MKKVIIGFGALALAVLGAYNASQNESVAISDLQIQNLEALAFCSESGWKCPGEASDWTEYASGSDNPQETKTVKDCMCNPIKCIEVTRFCN